MIIEEAGEIVLKADPWAMCAICRGSGRLVQGLPDDKVPGTDDPKTERVPCWCCESAGFFLPPDVERAYQLLNSEIPPKPLTPADRIAKMVSKFIKKGLLRTIVARLMFPALKL